MNFIGKNKLQVNFDLFVISTIITNLCYSLFEKYIRILEKYFDISGLIEYLAVQTLAQATAYTT